MASVACVQHDQQAHLALQRHAKDLEGDATQQALSDVTNHSQDHGRVKEADPRNPCTNRSKSSRSNVCSDSHQQESLKQRLAIRCDPEGSAQAQLQPSAAAIAVSSSRAEVHASEAVPLGPEYSDMAAAQAVSIPAPDAVSQKNASKSSASTRPASPMASSPMAPQADQGGSDGRVPLASRPSRLHAHAPVQGLREPEVSDRRRSKQGRQLASHRPNARPGPKAETTATIVANQIRGRGSSSFAICHRLHLWLRQ